MSQVLPSSKAFYSTCSANLEIIVLISIEIGQTFLPRMEPTTLLKSAGELYKLYGYDYDGTATSTISAN